jgi:hypothetical protein
MIGTSISRLATVASVAVLALMLSAFAGCDDEDSPLFPGVPKDVSAQLAALRKSIEPYRAIDAAKAAGYQVVVAHPTGGHTCLTDAQQGGMGVHYLKPTLVDDSVIAAAPEVLIYEPRADGSLDLVAVEYIIPFDIRGDDQAPPVLFGQQFKRNYTFNLWALHAWVMKDNPSGVFADYNPTVSCAHGD